MLYLSYRGLTASEIAIYSIILNAMTAFCEVPTGVLGDKIGTRNSVILGCVLLTLHAIIMVNTHNHIILIVMGGVEGVAYTFISGSDSALLYEILEEKEEQSIKKDNNILLIFTICAIIIIACIIIVIWIIKWKGDSK